MTPWRAGHGRVRAVLVTVGAVLMTVGAVITPVTGPLGAGLLALGLVVVTLTGPPAHDVEVADPLAPVTV